MFQSAHHHQVFILYKNLKTQGKNLVVFFFFCAQDHYERSKFEGRTLGEQTESLAVEPEA
jgi:hypothetical protein